MPLSPAAPMLDGLDASSRDFLDRVVAAARSYLGADVSFLAEFQGEEKVIRHVQGGEGEDAGALVAGMRFPLESTYCHRVACGELPEAIYDAAADPRVRDLPITTQLGIRSYIGVPLRLPGRVPLGTLCCINFEAPPSQQDRDLGLVRFLAELVGQHLTQAFAPAELRRLRIERVRAVLDGGGPRMAFQPIVDLATGGVIGAEALARFDTSPDQPPDAWFREAWDLGLGEALELAAVRGAVAQIAQLPAHAYLSVNLSPATLLEEGLFELLKGLPPGRVVVEITEHAAVADYGRLATVLGRLRASGVRLAIDDLGAGYSSLRHVLQIQPDMAKLDMSLTRHIDTDTAKQALTQAVMGFARTTRLDVVVEGIETEAEARAVQALGVRYGQGFFYCRPQALPFGSG